MVTIIDYKQRQTANGETFYSLILQGQLEMIQSEETGNFYATARKTSITSTLNEAACKNRIGQAVSGEIIKVELNYLYQQQKTRSSNDDRVFIYFESRLLVRPKIVFKVEYLLLDFISF